MEKINVTWAEVYHWFSP